MADEKLTIGELGAYTNNSPNKEGLKKLVGIVNTPGVDAYTKTETDALLDDKQDVLTAGDNISIVENVISATDTTYEAGTGISIVDGVISANGSDWEIVQNITELQGYWSYSGTNPNAGLLKKDLIYIIAKTPSDGNRTLFSLFLPKGLRYRTSNSCKFNTASLPQSTATKFYYYNTIKIESNGLISIVNWYYTINNGVIDFSTINSENDVTYTLSNDISEVTTGTKYYVFVKK